MIKLITKINKREFGSFYLRLAFDKLVEGEAKAQEIKVSG
jgi:hypothetical protein